MRGDGLAHLTEGLVEVGRRDTSCLAGPRGSFCDLEKLRHIGTLRRSIGWTLTERDQRRRPAEVIALWPEPDVRLRTSLP
jgi:hypothetical protein